MSNQVKHTAEPWHLGSGFLAIYDQYGWGVAGVTKHPHQVSGERPANARRIVACVNACRGLSTDDLEKHGLVSAVGTELIELEKQRDAAWAELREIRSAINANPEESTADEVRRVVAERDDLKRKNAELMAQVSLLINTLKFAENKLYILVNTKDGVTKQVRTDALKAFDAVKSAITTTPAQHLREVQAEAVASAVNANPEKVAYIQFEAQTRAKGFHCEIWLSSSDLIRYANQIRKGEVK